MSSLLRDVSRKGKKAIDQEKEEKQEKQRADGIKKQ